MNKAMLIILDGWGIGPLPDRSAIAQANTPFFDNLMQRYPHCTLTTFGESVGLPEGQMGNSEVGHMHIGAGRVIYQDLVKINKAIQSNSLAQNPIILEWIAYSKENNVPIHLLGLVSDGGVHSHISHLLGLIDILDQGGAPSILIHAFTDGRDTDPKSGVHFISRVIDHIGSRSHIRLATICGRYYAMDRDKRWDRIQRAYRALVCGEGRKERNPIDAMNHAYQRGETDEFIRPIVLVDEQNNPIGRLKEGDAALFFNFRTDRPRELTTALTQRKIPEYDMHPLAIRMATFTLYDDTFDNLAVVFPKTHIQNTLGEVIARNGGSQLRIAETEKYPHVTFFFSGGREVPFQGERRIMIPSPKVATYDLQPEMSALEVTEAVLNTLREDPPDFICLNFANADMVGHTGNFDAAIRAAETVDHCLQKIVPLAQQKGYATLLIADHGNADYMINDDGTPNTAHSLNPVPCILTDANKQCLHDRGYLYDIAPTILNLMGLPVPEDMKGQILFDNRE